LFDTVNANDCFFDPQTNDEVDPLNLNKISEEEHSHAEPTHNSIDNSNRQVKVSPMPINKSTSFSSSDATYKKESSAKE